MTTYYEVKRCLRMSFVKSADYIECDKKYKTYHIDDNNSVNDFITTLENEHLDSDEVINVIVNAESSEFSDIEFSIDEDKKGTLNTQNKTQNVKGDILLGAGNTIDAYSCSKFAIIEGKHSAGVQCLHPKQNHDVIDSLAVNGVLYSPKVISSFSIGKIMNALTKIKFNIYIIHSALSVNVLTGAMPSSYVRPTWFVGNGEILAVFYRYLCLFFFGYQSIYDDEDYDRRYDI